MSIGLKIALIPLVKISIRAINRVELKSMMTNKSKKINMTKHKIGDTNI